ncbi:MAG: hypothetical protein QM704_23970 [Anaeromyxobacteraceae bacterium]
MGVLACAAAAALAACGGGGGGGEEEPVPAPTVSAPAAATALELTGATFTVVPAGTVTSLRWQRDGADLADGPDASGAVVSGATTATLTLAALPLAWNGASLRAVVTGPGGSATSAAAALTVEPRVLTAFHTDFEEAALVPELAPGVAAIEGVQQYAGLGGAVKFAGHFLRSPTGNTVTLTLAGLPSHQAIDVLFLLAAIDSLDGTGTYPQGDFFRVDVDGATIFRESFANATAAQTQSYVPPAGVELARRVNLGFGGPDGYYTDSAYDLAADPAFSGIPHTASTLTVTFVVEGPGIQDLSDESWAIDELRVALHR